MNRIGLYSLGKTPKGLPYHGLHRSNDLVDYLDVPQVADLVKEMFSESCDGLHKVCTQENAKEVLELCSRLSALGWDGECLFFSEEPNPPDYLIVQFLGIEISGSSCYYSPLGDGFFDSYDKKNHLWADASFEIFRYYADGLNANMLFHSIDVAASFTTFCNERSKQFPHAIETEECWKPIYIYKILSLNNLALDR